MLKLEIEQKLTPLQRACLIRPRPEFELFDLMTDPGESRDLSGQWPEIYLRLVSELERWRGQFPK